MTEKCDVCGKESNQELIPINDLKSRIHTIQISRDWAIAPSNVCYKCYKLLETKKKISNYNATYMGFILPRVMRKIVDKTTIPKQVIKEAIDFIDHQFKGWYKKKITTLHRIAGLMWLLKTKKLDEYTNIQTN